MKKIKLAYIGGGSKEWAHVFMNDLTLTEGLTGEIALYDIDLAAAKRNDVTDAVEDIVIRLYMYNVRSLRPEVSKFTQVILDCCVALKRVMEEFHNFKKSKTINSLIDTVLRLEEKCDEIYIKAVRDLFVNEKDPVTISIWSDLFQRLEQCCDACGHVSSTVETAYMKNL